MCIDQEENILQPGLRGHEAGELDWVPLVAATLMLLFRLQQPVWAAILIGNYDMACSIFSKQLRGKSKQRNGNLIQFDSEFFWI